MSSEIGESSNLVDRTNESSLKEYEQQTYEVLSKEFKELYRAGNNLFHSTRLHFDRALSQPRLQKTGN
jgi:hypothetical protein